MTVTLINGFIFLSHPAEWSTPPSHKRNWETEVAESLPGLEARQSLRAVARRQMTFTILAGTLPERVRLEARLDAAKVSGLACAPLHGRGSPLAAAAQIGDTSLSIAESGWNWQAGDYAALVADDQTFDVLPVTAVTDAGLTLDCGPGTLDYAWPEQTFVRPLLFGAFTMEKIQAIGAWLASVKVTISELTSARAAQLGVTPAGKLGIGQMAVGQDFTVGGK